MKWANTLLFAKQFLRDALLLRSFFVLYVIFTLIAAFAAVSGVQNHVDQIKGSQEHQKEARASWEANPDKHPHRMAHFGTFAFRENPTLSIFDFGLKSFTGNGIFLEAHRQNSVNFSDASFSTGSLRFGELSPAMLLQLVLPLTLFFIGFASIASDRQNGTLKILVSQGGNWLEMLFGKSLGLFAVSLSFVLPIVIMLLVAIFAYDLTTVNDLWLRIGVIMISYLLFFFIISVLVVVISASSNNPKHALLRLLGLWLLLVILLPKLAQAFGNYLHPTPSNLAFQTAIEKDVIQKGDSHNPDDPYYNNLRDSVLAKHQVNDVTELSFNYGGFVMREGEKVSSQIYRKHYQELLGIYQRQNNSTKILSYVNPFLAIKQISMTLSGTDFSNYVDFQEQADDYRYALAQEMNELQMEYISPKKKSGSEGKVHVVDHEHWQEFPDFKHEQLFFSRAFSGALPAIVSLIVWLGIAFFAMSFSAKKLRAL